MNKKTKHFLIAAAFSALLFLALGIPTSLIPNQFFARMAPAGFIDYSLLAITAVLGGSYASYCLYLKNSASEKGNCSALGGVFTAIFGFGCPICNSLLVALFGTAALLLYFEPYRHLLALPSLGLFALAFYLKRKKCEKCHMAKNLCI